MVDDTLVRTVVGAATRAPSVHNTQPWRFVAHDDVIELWTDPSRSLPVLDPDGRARHLSCGAALVMARVAATGLGIETRTELAPDPARPDHLADLHLGAAGSHQPDDAERALAAAVDVRHTERGVFGDGPVPAELVDALGDAVRAEGCWLRVVGSGDDAAAVTVLLARADEAQSADPAYREELRTWTGRDEQSPDGVPTAAVPEAAPVDRGSSFRLRDFDADRDQSPHWSADPPPAEHPVVVVLGSVDDDVAGWLAAGQAMGRLLLTATASGLAASPMTQALEVPDTRARLTRELGTVGHPQVVLRVGLAPAATKSTHGHANRRPLEDVLDIR